MPYRQANLPSYRLHKSSGQAVVTLAGQDRYLGPHGSAQSRALYQRLIRDYLNAGAGVRSAPMQAPLLVAQLCEAYLRFAQRQYRTLEGTETGTVENTRLALRALFEFAADVEVGQFGPRMLLGVREALVESGLARSTINDRIGIIRRAFKWGTENELVPPSVLHGLQAVTGLRYGRGGARETEPVRPAPEANVRAALPFMPEPVRAMVELQLLTGARPSEILLMRASEIDRSGPLWIYRPSTHKNTWRGQERLIYIGPKGQEIVREFLRPGLQERYLFSPTLAELRRRDRLRAARKTPLYPSHVRALERKRRASPQRQPRDHYDTDSYRQAITRACKRAKVPPFRPNQLRHNAATRLRAEFGLDVAKAVLGHRRVETTQIYAEADRSRAMEAMERTG